MISPLSSVAMCMLHQHDRRLLLAAVLVCAVGVYASFALASHAARSQNEARKAWGLVAILASGCTAWATHFIVLLAFRPGMPSAFDPFLTAASLLCALAGIGTGMAIAIGKRSKKTHFVAGLILGLGIVLLHYVGQAAYLVQGTVDWNLWLVVPSILVSLPISGLALVAAAHRNRRLRKTSAPLLLLSIGLLHFSGMAAMRLTYLPDRLLPNNAVSPGAITPIVAGVCLGLLLLAVVGWRFDLVAKARIRHDRRRLRDLADVAMEGLLICKDDIIVTANNSIERLSGYGASDLVGASIGSLFPAFDVTLLPEQEEREGELVGANGEPVPVRVLRRDVPLGHKLQTVIAVRDQRERLRTEARIRALAFSDPLTGLPNRTRFLELISRHTFPTREPGQAFSVLMIDLDGFKPVNDTLGHAAGDLVLRLVAERITAMAGEADVVARLGGDEFVVLQTSPVDADAAETLALRIVAAVSERTYRIESQAITVGASVGLACWPQDGADPEELLRNADLALYAAKAGGKARFRRYDLALDARARERRALETGLRQALTEGHFELHYQPLVDARTGRITSAEALVRWRHPERGLIPPGDFIALAEETGLIVPLGEWVLRTACAEATTWPDDIAVAVNLSPVQFRLGNMAATIQGALEASGLSPGRLDTEITEGVLLEDEEETLRTLQELRELGIRISMDDFGTGYSSLGYLRRFPFDRIKIDRSFVRQVPDDLESATIVRAIITMGKCLGMTMVVEGVETSDQLEFAAAEGCNTIQGYYISRPLAAGAFASFVNNQLDRSPEFAKHQLAPEPGKPGMEMVCSTPPRLGWSPESMVAACS